MPANNDFHTNGFAIVDHIYTADEVAALVQQIGDADTNKDSFRKSAELFAIRQFLKEIPSAPGIIINSRLKEILSQVFGSEYFIVKSIYFDKPQSSNWYVSYHQDLTISVDRKLTLEGFNHWTVKQNQFAVQPPLDILENIVTVRIHLDDTDEHNGALKVIPGSHAKGIYRPETIDWAAKQEVNCPVPQGGIMLMKPLLLHSSQRTTRNHRRRVIHIEFSDKELPSGINWAERIDLHE